MCVCVYTIFEIMIHECIRVECDTYKHWSGSYPEKLLVTYALFKEGGKWKMSCSHVNA